MKNIKVRDIMVPIEQYATVGKDQTLHEAVAALEKAQAAQAADRYRHRAVLVYGDEGKIVGKISQLDLIKGLEKGYTKMGDMEDVSHSGYSRSFLKSLAKKHGLWNEPLRDICRKGVKIKVEDIMYTPSEGEYVKEDATLDEAIHQLVMGSHQSLLVAGESGIVGVLRLTDVFKQICDVMKNCEILDPVVSRAPSAGHPTSRPKAIDVPIPLQAVKISDGDPCRLVRLGPPAEPA